MASSDPAALSRPARRRRPLRQFWRQREPFVWMTALALLVMLFLTSLLVLVVFWNGLGIFWPDPVARIEVRDEGPVLGIWVRDQVEPRSGVLSRQWKTANRELDPRQMDFRWIRADRIASLDYPPDVTVLERSGNGDYYGFFKGFDWPDSFGDPPRADLAGLRDGVGVLKALEQSQAAPLRERLAGLGSSLQQVHHAILKLDYQHRRQSESNVRDGRAPSDFEARRDALRLREKELKEQSDRAVGELESVQARLRTVQARFETVRGDSNPIPLLDIVRVWQPNGMAWGARCAHYASKVRELFFAAPRESNTEGGLFPAIFGTVMLIVIMAVLSFPLGVLAGLYLGEYARDGWLVRLVRVAVNNLAGIPSIVYGIFGLGFFIYGVGGAIDRLFFPELLEAGITTFGTGGILWASLTLGLLTVPVVIVSTEEALRTIPRGVKEGSLALGATRFQTVWRVLLPMASPGILTGFILAMARAAGEVAPLMITGVVKLAPSLPVDGSFPFLHLDRKFMHLGFHIYDIGFQSPNVEASKPMVYVTTLLLLGIVLVLTSLAILLRNHMRKRYQASSI